MFITGECDNKARCHEPKVIYEDMASGLRILCTICKRQYVIRCDPIKKVPLNRQYIKIYRKFSLQGNNNLFYKYNPQYLRT